MPTKYKSPNVGFIHPELFKLMPLYRLIRDVLSGEDAVKKAKEAYLPRPDPTDRSKENRERYEAYLRRAVFYNATRRTLKAMVGQVYMYQPQVKAPPIMDMVVSNATGEGVSIQLAAKRALEYTLAFSRAGVFVDYPSTEDDAPTSLADIESGRIRPTINIVHPQNIINWRTTPMGAEEIISLVVITEDFASMDDGFEITLQEQWRVLGLDSEGNYYQEVWRKVDDPRYIKSQRPEYYLYELTYPRDFNGRPLRFIPFQFIGSENNDSRPDNPNFYDLASVNIAHYRNSADYEESVFIAGQPTLVISGIDEQWRKDNEGTARVGSVGGIGIPKEGDAKFIQAQPNNLVKAAMEHKERQMVALGARLIEEKKVQRTATEASLDNIGLSSTLASTARNVSEAIDWALKRAAEFIGVAESDVSFTLNTHFESYKLNSDERRQLLEEWKSGLLTFEEAREALRKSGLATVDNLEAKEQIDAAMMDMMSDQQDDPTDISHSNTPKVD